MAQVTTGLRAILTLPAAYNLLQNVLGAEKARSILVRDYFPKKPGMRMLDIGCGTAEILRHLPGDVQYVGFDAYEAYIAQARERFGARGEFHAGMVGKTTLSDMGTFDFVMAFGVLHHLDDVEADALFSLARQALKGDGVLITIDPCYVPGQHAFARWLISKDRGQNVRNEAGYGQLAAAHFTNVRSTPRHDLLRVPYTYLVLESRPK